MNVTQQGILALLKSAVTEQPQPLPEGFDLEAAAPVIRRHHMAALIYAGAVCCGVDQQQPVMRKLRQSYCRAMLLSEGQMAELGRVFAAFEENGIDHMPLKGCNMKSLYPKPELRMMGDADVLIRMEQYPGIIPILEELGFTAKEESDHELVWTTGALYLELHKRLIPSYNIDLHSYFGDGWQFAKNVSGSRWDMSPEDTFVFLFAHFAKHYRDGGIGCRHVVDLWVYLRAHPELRMQAVYAALERLKLREFYDNISRLLEMWFAGGQGDDKLEYISDFLFSSGSWGELEERMASANVRDLRQAGSETKRKLRYLWRVIFPGTDALKRKYTVLQRAPWLLPAVWLLRPFHKLFCERELLGWCRYVTKNLGRGKVDARKQMLNYVGLDYHGEL